MRKIGQIRLCIGPILGTKMATKNELKPVELGSRWFQILGNKRNEMPDNIRRERWEQWKALAIADDCKELVDYWTNCSGCGNCINKDKDWCKLQELPCCVNPILTYQHNVIGLACMGLIKDGK